MDIYSYSLADFSKEDFEILAPLCEKKHLSPQSIIAHAMVKKRLAMFYGTNAADIKFNYTEHGKPFYKSDIKFSISHSYDIVSVAFGSFDLGIDAEKIRNINRRILSRTVTEKEAELLINSDDFDKDFLTVWTVKEAYFKLIGTGIVKPELISAEQIKKTCNVNTIFSGSYIITTAESKN